MLATAGIVFVAAACGSETPVAPTQGSSAAGGAGGDAGGQVSSSGSATGGNGGAAGAGGGSAGGGGAGGTGGMVPWSGPVEALAMLDLGDLAPDVEHFFPVPDRTLGLTVVVEAPLPDDPIGIFRLRPPAGGSVIYDFSMTDHDAKVFSGVHWISGASPQSDESNALPVQEGEWRLELGDNIDMPVASAKTRVWVRRTEDGQFHGGEMDVNVFIAPGVSDSGYVGQVLAAMFAGGYAGISMGDVTYASLDAKYTVVDTYDEHREMLATTGGVIGAPAVNLFVVGNFADADFGGAIGVAGGIPGIACEHGTKRSGVAYQPSGDVAHDATVLAHEIGHLGGLFHTTEFKIVDTDPLTDTPECPDATIQSDPGSCPDQGNVMFPIAYGGTTFTAAQIRVLEGSALYRGALVDGGPPAQPLSPPPLPRRAPADLLERLLDSVWCAEAGDHRDLVARVARARLGSRAGAFLVELANDSSRTPLVRARALTVLGRLQPDAFDATRIAERWLRDSGLPRLLRVAALEALGPRALHAPVAGDPDPVVRAMTSGH